MFNTPFFVNSIQEGVNNFRNNDPYPYKSAAFLFLNSLPLATLREKYKTYENGATTDLDYIFATIKKFGAIHKVPYAWILKIGSIKIDTNRRQVYKNNDRIRLTGMEFSLLELLVSRSGEAFSRAAILQEVWGYTPERHVDTRVVDVHISRLRAKLEEDPSNPDLIITARGTGYLFQRITEMLKSD